LFENPERFLPTEQSGRSKNEKQLWILRENLIESPRHFGFGPDDGKALHGHFP
jgi:hypothetical protein